MRVVGIAGWGSSSEKLWVEAGSAEIRLARRAYLAASSGSGCEPRPGGFDSQRAIRRPREVVFAGGAAGRAGHGPAPATVISLELPAAPVRRMPGCVMCA